MVNRLHVVTGCRNVYARKVFEERTNSIEAKETFGDGFGRNYTNSQSSDQIRQVLISRVIDRLLLLFYWNSNLVPLLEGLCSSNPCRFEFLGFSQLCRKEREAWGERSGNLAVERYGRINSACYEGIATTVTVAHHSIWRHLYDSLHATKRPKSKIECVTLDNESSISTLWRREEVLKICTGKDLAEKA